MSEPCVAGSSAQRTHHTAALSRAVEADGAWLVMGLVVVLAGPSARHLAHAAIGTAALTCFYLAVCLIRPDGMGLGDAELAASAGLVLGWTSWQALLNGTSASD